MSADLFCSAYHFFPTRLVLSDPFSSPTRIKSSPFSKSHRVASSPFGRPSRVTSSCQLESKLFKSILPFHPNHLLSRRHINPCLSRSAFRSSSLPISASSPVSSTLPPMSSQLNFPFQIPSSRFRSAAMLYSIQFDSTRQIPSLPTSRPIRILSCRQFRPFHLSNSILVFSSRRFRSYHVVSTGRFGSLQFSLSRRITSHHAPLGKERKEEVFEWPRTCS